MSEQNKVLLHALLMAASDPRASREALEELAALGDDPDRLAELTGSAPAERTIGKRRRSFVTKSHKAKAAGADDEDGGAPGADLARWYARWFEALEESGLEPTPDDIAEAEAELDGSGWSVGRDDSGDWRARPTSTTVKKSWRRLDKAAQRAPAGFTRTNPFHFNGRDYVGGQFIPGKAVESASPADREKLAQAKESEDRSAEAKKQARGSQAVDLEGLKRSVAPAHGLELTAAERGNAARAYAALKRHHGGLTLHRVAELAGKARQALDAVGDDHPNAEGLRDYWSRQLAAIASWVGRAEGEGMTGAAAVKPAAGDAGQPVGESPPVVGDAGAARREADRLIRNARPASPVTQQRATAGGEVGPNGEWYPGGAFIATTDMPKRLREKLNRAAASRGEEVAPGERGEAEPGTMPIFQLLQPGWYLDPWKMEFTREAQPFRELGAAGQGRLEELLGRFKAGERFVPIAEYPEFARIADVARAAVAGEAVPGEALGRMPDWLREALAKYRPPGGSPGGAGPHGGPLLAPPAGAGGQLAQGRPVQQGAGQGALPARLAGSPDAEAGASRHEALDGPAGLAERAPAVHTGLDGAGHDSPPGAGGRSASVPLPPDPHFTGTLTDSAGRTYQFVDGVRVAAGAQKSGGQGPVAGPESPPPSESLGPRPPTPSRGGEGIVPEGAAAGDLDDRIRQIDALDAATPTAKRIRPIDPATVEVIRDEMRANFPGVRVRQLTTKLRPLDIRSAREPFTVEENNAIRRILRRHGIVQMWDGKHMRDVDSRTHTIGGLVQDADGRHPMYAGEEQTANRPSWAMTAHEFASAHADYANYERLSQSGGTSGRQAVETLARISRQHADAVEHAILAGRPVPSAVLKDHPGLVAKHGGSIEQVEPGFTGTLTDSAGRTYQFVDGKRVAAGGEGAAAPRTHAVFQGRGRADQSGIYAAGQGPVLDGADYYAFDERSAGRYGPDVSRAEVSLSSPAEITSDRDWLALAKEAGVPSDLAMSTTYGGDKSQVLRAKAKLREYLVARGHDGLVVRLDPKQETRRAARIFGHDQLVKFRDPASLSENSLDSGDAPGNNAPVDAQPREEPTMPESSETPAVPTPEAAPAPAVNLDDYDHIEGVLKDTPRGRVLEAGEGGLGRQFGRAEIPGLKGHTFAHGGKLWKITAVGNKFERGRGSYRYLYVEPVGDHGPAPAPEPTQPAPAAAAAESGLAPLVAPPGGGYRGYLESVDATRPATLARLREQASLQAEQWPEKAADMARMAELLPTISDPAFWVEAGKRSAAMVLNILKRRPEWGGVPTPPASPAAGPRQPWEMTREEFRSSFEKQGRHSHGVLRRRVEEEIGRAEDERARAEARGFPTGQYDATIRQRRAELARLGEYAAPTEAELDAAYRRMVEAARNAGDPVPDDAYGRFGVAPPAAPAPKTPAPAPAPQRVAAPVPVAAPAVKVSAPAGVPDAVSGALSAAGFKVSVADAPGGGKRLTVRSAQSQTLGHIDVGADGTVEPNIFKQSAAVHAALPRVEVSAPAPTPEAPKALTPAEEFAANKARWDALDATVRPALAGRLRASSGAATGPQADYRANLLEKEFDGLSRGTTESLAKEGSYLARLYLAEQVPAPADKAEASKQIEALRSGGVAAFARANPGWARPLMTRLAEVAGPQGEKLPELLSAQYAKLDGDQMMVAQRNNKNYWELVIRPALGLA